MSSDPFKNIYYKLGENKWFTLLSRYAGSVRLLIVLSKSLDPKRSNNSAQVEKPKFSRSLGLWGLDPGDVSRNNVCVCDVCDENVIFGWKTEVTLDSEWRWFHGTR